MVENVQITITEVVHGIGHKAESGFEVGLSHGTNRLKGDRLGFEAKD